MILIIVTLTLILAVLAAIIGIVVAILTIPIVGWGLLITLVVVFPILLFLFFLGEDN